MPIQQAPPPAPVPPPPADDDDDSEQEHLSDPNLCEECHRKPKHYDSTRGILYQFCGRRCRDANAVREAQPHCKLKGCKKTFNSNDDYCSQEHAQEAVKKGEAQACPVCHVNPISTGFKHCSRDCAIKQANQPKMNGLARAVPGNPFRPAFTPPPAPRSSLPPPPPPANTVNKDADAPTPSEPEPCEHCGTRPRNVKVYRHCSKECARAARAGRKPGGHGDSDEDSLPEDTPPSKKPQPGAYDDDDDDGWGAVQSPLPQQPQVNPGNSKTYSCCGCTVTVPSGSPPAECPICKLDEVKKELEAEKAKPPVYIHMPQSPPAPPPAPAPAPPPPAPAPAQAPAPAPKRDQPIPRARPGGPVPQPGLRRPNPTPVAVPPPPPIKPAPPQPEPSKQPPKPPVQPAGRRMDEDEDDDDDDDMDFFVRQPDPPPAPAPAPKLVTVESDDEDDEDFFVR